MEDEGERRYPFCANCAIEIRWRATIVDGKNYCCWGCSQGGPCACDYEHLPLNREQLEVEPTGTWPEQPMSFSRLAWQLRSLAL